MGSNFSVAGNRPKDRVYLKFTTPFLAMPAAAGRTRKSCARLTDVVAASIEGLEGRRLLSGVSFIGASGYTAGTTNAIDPWDSATADLNGDGNLDVVTRNATTNNVSVLLGSGDGTLQLAVNYLTTGSGRGLSLGDFNGDARTDILASDYDGDIDVLLGNGDGTFLAAVTTASPSGYDSEGYTTAGDFNADGKLDAAVGMFATSGFVAPIAVFIGNGNGTFQTPVVYTAPGPASAANFVYGIEAADLNGDTKLDLVATNRINQRVSVFVGNGDGTFQPGVNYAIGAGGGPWNLTLADFNGDGKTDVATSNVGNQTVSVLLGNGDATFQAGVAYALGGGQTPNGLISGDFNADGKTDLATANNSGSGRVTVLLGNGDGTLQSPTNLLNSDYNGRSVTTGDLNNDGLDDLVLTANPSVVQVLLGSPGGTFVAAPAPNYVVGSNPHTVASGDFDNDGRADLVAANYSGGTLSFLRTNSDGTLQPQVSSATTPNPFDMAAADFDGDGDLDVVTVHEGAYGAAFTIVVSIGNGNGTFAAPVTFAGTSTTHALTRIRSVRVADVDADGKLDVVATNDDEGLSTSGLLVFRGNGDGTFNPAVRTPAGVATSPYDVTLGHFDNDGKLDAAVANTNGTSAGIYLGNGDGTFQPPTNLNPANSSSGSHGVASGDLNGDGKSDLVFAYNGAETLGVMLGNGDGTFQTQVLYAGPGVGAFRVVLADFDVDGKLDVAASSRGSYAALVWAGNGDGTLAPAKAYNVGPNPEKIVAGDFDKDGRPDLATANANGGSVSVLMNDSDSNPSLAVTTAADEDDGTSNPGVGTGTSLREAIAFAKANPGDDTVTFDPTVFDGTPGTQIVLSRGQLLIDDATAKTTIRGLGAALVTVDGNADVHLIDFRVFDVAAGGDVEISGLTVTGGEENFGGGIRNVGGTLAVVDAVVTSNTARVRGGGVYASGGGTTTLTRTTLSDNAVTDSANGNGGGLALVGGTAELVDATVSGNTSGGHGGGVYAGSGNAAAVNVLDITGTTLSGNTAGRNGGGVFVEGTATIDDSTISGNSGTWGGGVDLSFDSVATLTDVTVSGNTANFGGGINVSGSATVTDSLVSGNTADFGGGVQIGLQGAATIARTTVSGNDGGLGGGLEVSGTAQMFDSAVSGNTGAVGAGLRISGTTTLANVTVGGNTAGVNGGGAYVSGMATFVNVTVADNAVAGPDAAPEAAGGLYTEAGANVSSRLTNTIVAGNGPGGDVGGPYTGSANVVGGDPKLGPLADNGGPTKTYALMAGSPALDAGDDTLLPADVIDADADADVAEPIPFDQRGPGYARAVGTVDVGAFEAQAGGVAVAVYADADADGTRDGGEAGSAGVAVTLKQGAATVASGTTAPDGTVTFADLAPGSYAVVATAPPGTFGTDPSDGSGTRTVVVAAGGTADAAFGFAPFPTFDITPKVEVVEGNAGVAPLVFTVTRTSGVGVAAVDFATADGSAGVSGDYNAAAGSVFFAPGVLSRTVTVDARGDTAAEPDQDFFVVLSNPVNGTIGDGVGRGVILNDDTALPQIAVGDAAVTEGNSGTKTLGFKVTLSRPTDQLVTFKYKTTNGTAGSGDFTAVTGTGKFGPRVLSTTVNVTVKGDATFEPDEVFYLDLSTPTNAGISDNRGVGTIVNDDGRPQITILNAADVTEGNSGTRTMTFTVKLSNPSSGSVTVKYATADGTAMASKNDYQAKSGTLTFAAGEVSKTVTVTVVGDTRKGTAFETVFVNLSSPVGASILDGQGVGRIVNDD